MTRRRDSTTSSSMTSDFHRPLTRFTSSPALSMSTFSTCSTSTVRHMRRLYSLGASRASLLASYRSQPGRTKGQMGRRHHVRHPFQAYARLTVICVRLCRISRHNLDREKGQYLTIRQLFDIYTAGIDKSGLFFDPSDFLADKQSHVPSEAKRILKMSVKDRTQHDIEYLLIALSNIPAFAEYPTRMQKRLCQVGWFESYEPRRAIIRERDPPSFFYFILSGTVVVTQFERQYGTTRALVTLDQGMSFGELAVITGSRRQATVSTMTEVELLCISARDFEDIFMAGGRKIITDPDHNKFLRSVDFLKPWPVHQLAQHPQACMFHYFNRGQVLVRDSNNSDWIYIVKSGSLSVMKKLHHASASDRDNTEGKSNVPEASKPKRKKRGRAGSESPEIFRNQREANRRLEQTLPGVFNMKERLGLVDYDKVISEYRSRVQTRHDPDTPPLVLPPIHTLAARLTASHPARGQDGAESVASDAAEVERETEGSEEVDDDVQVERTVRKTAKGVYMTPTTTKRQARKRAESDDRRTSEVSLSSDASVHTAVTATDQSQSLAAQLFRLNIDYQRRFREHVGRKTMADQLDHKGSRDFRYTEMDFNPMFVVAQVLERGQYFGVSQLLYPDQPSLSLVSNGAELVVLSKKLFLDHATDACMRHLRRTECPFPSQEVLQSRLQDYVDWEAHRSRVYNRLLSDLQQRRHNRKQFLPVIPSSRYCFRSGPL